MVFLVFSSNIFSAISRVSKVSLMGISLLVQRLRNLCAGDVKRWVCYAGQATLYTDFMYFSLSSSTMPLQSSEEIQIFHCSGDDEVKIWCV